MANNAAARTNGRRTAFVNTKIRAASFPANAGAGLAGHQEKAPAKTFNEPRAEYRGSQRRWSPAITAPSKSDLRHSGHLVTVLHE